MPIQFNAPASGSGYFKPADANGHLILITTVHRLEQQYSEMAGREITVAICDLVDLTGDQQLRENITVTYPGIVNGLRPGATYVLGRIGQAPTKKGHPAWVLRGTADKADIDTAAAWVDAQAAGRFTAPAAPAAAAPAAQAPTITSDINALPADTRAALKALLGN